jgi:hypothetical protein
MLAKSLLISLCLFSTTVFAKSLNCDVNETLNGELVKQSYTVEAVNNPHGAMLSFKGKAFPEMTGFISLLENEGRLFAVLSLYSEKLNANSSGQFQMVANEQYAELQFIVPSDSTMLSGVEILCQYFE